MKAVRSIFVIAALAGMVAVVARKLGLIGSDEDESPGFVFEDAPGEESADGGEDDAAE